MPFDPDQYLAEKSGGTGTFDPDKYLSEKESFPERAWNDLKGNFFGAVDTLKGTAGTAVDLLKSPFDPTDFVADAVKGGQVLRNIPSTLKKEGERIGLPELGGIGEHDPSEFLPKFGNAFSDKPVTTALDVLPFLPAAKGLKGAQIAEEAAPIAETASKVAPIVEKATPLMEETSKVIPKSVASAAPATAEEAIGTAAPKVAPIAEASQVAPIAQEAAKPFRPVDSLVDETLSALGNKAKSAVKDPMEAVNDYLKKQYGKISEKPGFADTIGTLLERKAKTMRLKEVGFSPGQIRKLVNEFGEEKTLGLADIAKEKGITKPVLGYKVGQQIENLENMSGKTIGDIRQIAGQRGAVHNPDVLVQAIKQQLDPVYLGKGSASSMKGSYLKALEDVKSAASTPDKLADKLTWMNEHASKNKMTQAPGAITDVANTASRINNELIKKYLNPAETETYQSALKDFGLSKLFKKGYAFKVGRELAGRSGVGSMVKNMYQWGMDTFGNKFVENVSDGIGRKIKANPNMVKNPHALMEEVIKQMSDTLDEIGDEFVQ